MSDGVCPMNEKMPARRRLRPLSPPRRAARMVAALFILCVCVVTSAATYAAPAVGPIVLTEPTTTRAIAVDALTLMRDPFPLASAGYVGSDRRTRIMFFALNLDLYAGESASAVVAEAEDGARRTYMLTVEAVNPVPGFEGVKAITVRLSDDLGDVGDVLVRLSLHGNTGNRVRISIGHVGGGLPDDAGSVPTPAPATPPAAIPSPTPDPYTSGASATDAVRFLEQATWGPTPAEVAHVQAIGFRAYLNEQFNAPASSYPTLPLFHVDSAQGCPQTDATLRSACTRDNYSMYPLQLKFFQHALAGQDQLRQRVAFALHQIFVVSGRDINEPSYMAPYLQILDRNAFGNYRQLLNDITLNPAMGRYLDMAGNTRSNPNENYAREVLQLFSVGVDELNLDGTSKLDAQGNHLPTYTQDTITNFARVFTGWNLATSPGPGLFNYLDPMVVSRETNHDTGAKQLLRGTNVPGNQTSTQDLQAALDNIFNHPNVGPFIGKQLIQHLVTSNPSPGYVARVAAVFNNNCAGWYADNCTNARGDLKATVRAVLLDPEARGDAKTAPSYGRLREPVQLINNVLRAGNAKSFDRTGASDGYLAPNAATLDQDVFRPPTVFSYYSSGYRVPGTNLLGPAFEILSTATALRRANFVNTIIYTGVAVGTNAPAGTQLDLSAYEALAADPTQLVAALDQIMTHDALSAPARSAITSAISTIGGTDAAGRRKRAQAAFYLVATSSQFQVQR